MATYYGNQVAYGNGAWWRVEMDISDSGATTAGSMTVYYRYRIRSSSSIVDSSNSVVWSDPWGSGSKSVSINFPQSGGSMIPVGGNPSSGAAVIYYGSTRVLTFRITVDNIAGGNTGPSTLTVNYTLPARKPVAPSSPGTSVDTITATSARIVVTASASNGGAGINRYDAYVTSNNKMPSSGGIVVASATGGTFVATGLLPGTTYWYTAQARNSAGLWSPLTPLKSFTTLPAAHVNVNGVWKNALVYVNVSGVWKFAIPYVNVNGVWKLA